LPEDELERQLQQSWIANAAAWTDAVRQGRIASRKAGTDAAIRDAILKFQQCRVLDLGCGEGWLTRSLSELGYEVIGVDASGALIEEAQAAGGGRFLTLSYEQLISNSAEVAGPFDVIAANFSLLGEDLHPLLKALRSNLSRDGSLFIQTLHPANLEPGSPYESGWRIETFARMGPAFLSHMPYYFRTFGNWIEELNAAGFRIAQCREPLDADTRRPLSLLIEARSR
jgi:2-polyprenyl-3-methyl-5-hydroxy-6-metoxy-1,4-benzoquinol methylase